MAVEAFAMTSGRFLGTAAAVIALAGAIAAGPALAGRLSAFIALAAATIGILTGGFVVATADGGPGTGNGIVGGYAAVVIGLIGAILGGIALRRSRRTALTRVTGCVDDDRREP